MLLSKPSETNEVITVQIWTDSVLDHDFPKGLPRWWTKNLGLNAPGHIIYDASQFQNFWGGCTPRLGPSELCPVLPEIRKNLNEKYELNILANLRDTAA